MIAAMLALAATTTVLPREDLQEVLASWEAGQLYCERGNKKACVDQRLYAAKMRRLFGLCPSKSGERGEVVVCKTGRKVEISFD